MGRLRAAPLAALVALCAAALGAACAVFPGLRADPQVEAWKDEAARLRGLEFVEPVRFRLLRPEETSGIVREELRASYGDDLERYRDAYVALGTLPRGIDLVETLLALYEEQLLGLYSPRKRTMYVVADAGAAIAGPIVVHELVHALQHQHFGRTLALALALRRNDDLVSALGAAMEGDASLTMLGVANPNGLQRDLPSAERISEVFRSGLTHPRGVMAEVPVLLRVGLVFPYAEGTMFAARNYSRGGNAALDEALRNAPLSTAELYFPEHDPTVEFLELPTRELSQRLAVRGCELGADNVAGAVTLDALFEQHAGAADRRNLTRAWRGDRFLHVECGATWELVWFTRWSSPGAAREFAVAYRAIAGSISELAPLSGTPTVVLDGRTALVVTPGLLDQVGPLLEATEIRSYDDFDAWFADACFPESPCPELER
ncbi:MAG: hypothetical protein V3V67_02020 [Myxococcota bacterium]